MKEGISRFDDFWALHVNGYIFLLSGKDFSEATQTAKKKCGETVWAQFLVAVSSFSRLSDAKRHASIERDTVKAIQNFFQQNPRSIPQYKFVGKEAVTVASTFIEACTTCPASKGLFTWEEIQIDGKNQWILREYYSQSLVERLSNKKRLAKTVPITPSKIEELNGNSTDFTIRVAGDWLRICHEGVRAP
ncbi:MULTISPECIES: hypothetical protein [Marinobacter]|jgi:hypothetical protein|uniref:Uncharacterized protein n=1 Tax=Marinobacter pelagius TaxID=379482 RepID=A0A1I4RG20_9GAMM|nr:MULTISPECIES: hypothetical protein [Marinobacter]MBC7193844.1 hypothetical protein [Marinobacter sp.]SFM51175.1 hypothetical protein SAMN04487961_0529 [Marinobacter pelagius]|tara:strand:- start:795 stop:1364 length:570 start_codon:yes stop_codon:yes gene_type:complete